MPGRTVHHVAVAVRDIDAALGFWRDALGLPLIKRASLPALGAEVALLALANSHIELVSPLDSTGALARFIDRRGEALNHVCLTTNDIAAEMHSLRDRGVELLDEAPRPGIDGLVCFLHPRAHAGVLVELVEARLDPAAVPLSLREVWTFNAGQAEALAAWESNLTLKSTRVDPGQALLALDEVIIKVMQIELADAANRDLLGLFSLTLAVEQLALLAYELEQRHVAIRKDADAVFVFGAPGHDFPLTLQRAGIYDER